MMKLRIFATLALVSQLCSAFVVPAKKASANKPFVLEAKADKNSIQNSIIASSMIMASTPLVSKAVEDTYEYGAGEHITSEFNKGIFY